MLIESLLVLGAFLASAAVVLAVEDLIGYVRAESVIPLITQSLPGLRGLAVEALFVAVAVIPALSSLTVLRDLKNALPDLGMVSDWIGIQTVVIALVPVVIFAAIHVLSRWKGRRDRVRDR